MVDDVVRFFLIGADRKTRVPFGAPGCAVRLAQTPLGLHGAPFTHDWEDAVGLDGSIYRGTKDEKGVISLKVWVADPTSSAAARRAHSKWREALGRGKGTCRLYAVTRESGYWWIDVRVASVSEAEHWGSPGQVGEVGETINFVSDRSFWQRFTEQRTFDRMTCANASLTNMGDQPAWLKWTISGEHGGVEIGVGETRATPIGTSDSMNQSIRDLAGYIPGTSGGIQPQRDTVHIPARKANDPPVIVDTNPAWPTIMTSTGVDLQSSLPNAYWDKPLPPRNHSDDATFPLVIVPKNPASTFRVDVEYIPRTENAW